MPVIRVGVQAPQGSPGQVVDLDGELVAISSITNVSTESIAYSLDGGGTWTTLAAGASGGATTISAGRLRMRKTTSAGAYPVNVDVDSTVLNLADDVVVARNYTWATLPAAADYIGTAYISDVGPRGSLWRSDGSVWGIVGGSVVLARGHTDLTVTAASTSEEDLVSVSIPAGLIGDSGQLEVTHFWEATNNANVKTLRVKLGGTAFFANAAALNSNAIFLPPPTRIWNRGSQSAQMAFAAANGNTTIATGTAKTTGTVDTSAATTLAISGQKATGSDTLTLLCYSVRLVRP